MWILIKHVNIVSGVKKVCHPKTCRWANTESFSCGDGQNRRTEQNRTPRYYSAGVSQFTSGAKKAHFLWLGVVQNTRIITASALAPFSMRVYFRASRVPCTVGSVHVRQLLARDPGTWSTRAHTHIYMAETWAADGPWLVISVRRETLWGFCLADTNWKIFIIMIQHLLPHNCALVGQLRQRYMEWPVFTFYFNELNVVISN